MRLRPSLSLALFYLAVLWLPATDPTQADAQPPRQNFVFILVDDLGYMDIGANNPDCFYDTPHIDALAKSGMRFTQAYAACQVCSPTRASILSGKYPARLHTTEYFGGPQPEGLRKRKRYRRTLLPARYLPQLPLAEQTLAETLKAAGYRTFFAGKWHLGGKGHTPLEQGFEVNMGGLRRGGPYGGKKYFSPYGNPQLPDGPKGEHLPARLAQETVRFIEQHRQEPFLAYLSFYSVHTPLLARKDLIAKYRARRAKLPEREPRFLPEGRRQARQVQDHAIYAGMVEAMDEAVGRVLACLNDKGLRSRTTVVFMSDNGGLSTSEGSPTSNVPLRAGKGWIYEGGIREPMIVRAPGRTRPGSVCDQPVISTDFYPSLLALAGLPPLPEQHVDGRSFVPLLDDPAAKLPPRPLFWHYPHYGNQGGAPSGAIRLGKYKLCEFFEDSRLELYDLSQDLSEQHNLAATMPDKVRELHGRLTHWRKAVGARMPTRNPRAR